MQTGFCPLLYVHFNDMQITGGSIYQVVPGKFPFTATFSEKEETQKISFLQEQVTELHQLFDGIALDV